MTEHSRLADSFAPSERTLPALLERRAATSERPLLLSGDTRWTGRDALHDARCFADTLAGAGVRRGDRVALACSNRIEFLQAFLGCAWLGAISVPINTASRGFQLQHILGNAAPRLLVIEEGLLPALDGVDLGGAAIERVMVIGGAGPSVEGVPTVPFELGAGSAMAAPVTIGDPLTIIYTSGTTGLSKGVVCPQGQLFWYGINTGISLQVRAGDVLHTTLPLFHVNALCSFFQALIHDATLVVEPRFSVSGYWRGVKASGATVTSLLGAMIPMLLSRPEMAEERDHTVRIASGPGVPEAMHGEFLRRTGIPLGDGYASTESNVAIISRPGRRRAGCMGELHDGFEAIVADEHDRALPDGEPGELLLRAHEPFAMALGYFNMPDKTVEAWRNLWLHTGDRVIRDADGYFRFMDRLKDAIRRRGENISSFEVEQVLLMHPAVALAAVFPVSSELAEDDVMAAIVLADDTSIGHEEVMRFCEGRMSYFSVPRFIEFVDELPRTDNGKIQKFKLRERGVTDAAWDRERAGISVRR
jgi:crotonobetaine/carnitine-CoA ligase